MKIITLYQPYAAAVAEGWKVHETRSWKTSYRGPIAIHAAANLSENQIAKAFRQIFQGQPYLLREPAALFERGKIIATAKLVEIQRTEDVARKPADDLDRAFGVWDPGRFAWRLEDPVPITPIPWKGAQGLRDLPREVVNLFKIR